MGNAFCAFSTGRARSTGCCALSSTVQDAPEATIVGAVDPEHHPTSAVHRAYNLGTEDAIEYNMFVIPPGRPIGVSIPDNEHRCGPPSTVGECSNGGWATFNHPFPFVNQGACVAYVNNRKRITLLVPEDPLQ